jgi:hypothetical protein
MAKYPGGLKSEAKLAISLGWKLVKAGSGHMKWYDPQGILRIVTSMTPNGNRRGILNAKADLKRFGVIP